MSKVSLVRGLALDAVAARKEKMTMSCPEMTLFIAALLMAVVLWEFRAGDSG